KNGLGVVLAVAMIGLGSTANAKVQCSCPKVAAEGEGQTSCSAAESGGRCTIDFNLFGAESEKRASELALRSGARRGYNLNPQYDTDLAMQAIGGLRDEDAQGAILVYLMVALGNQTARVPNTVRLESVKDLISSAQSGELARAMTNAFHPRTADEWRRFSD